VTNVEDIYELSPMQQGMLFDAQYTPEASELYLLQISFAWHVGVNLAAFEQAWQHVIDRHAILRTAFYSGKAEKALQIVYRNPETPLKHFDLRGTKIEDRRRVLAEYLDADGRTGFKLNQAPLMRMALIRMDEAAYHFIWTFHHILLEGWSASLVFNEVFTAYNALCGGEKILLDQVRPYRDYITWLQQQDRTRVEAYWRAALKGLTAPTQIGADHRPGEISVREPANDTRRRTLPLELSEAVRSVAKRHRLTINTLMQGAWARLLSCYSGEEQVVFGVVVSGRNAALDGVESMVGLLVNSLPFRVDVPPDAAVSTWLAELQAAQLELLQYEHSRLIDVQAWSEMPRGVPLFETLFVLENWREEVGPRGGDNELDIRESRVSYRDMGQPLSLIVFPGSKLSMEVLYDRRRFSAPTISRVLSHLERLLSSMATDSNQRLSDLQLLSDAELHQLLFEWNDTRRPVRQIGSCHALFEAQAELAPDAIAAVMHEEQISYGSLDLQADNLARRLRSSGVGPDVAVAICVERSIEMLVGMLGVLKSGGCYVPLDPAYPLQRIGAILKDAGVPVLLTRKGLSRELSPFAPRVICLDDDLRLVEPEIDSPLEPVSSDNLAYIIYTSGSTGTPKGVLVEHRGVLNLSDAQIDAFEVNSHDCVLQFASLTFDASLFEIMMAWRAGARLCLASQQDLLPGPPLINLLREKEVSCITITPSALAALPAEQLPALRTIIVAGEACPAELPRVWGAGRRFFNAYGPTEATVWASVDRCGTGDHDPTIGTPILNTSIHILEGDLKPAPCAVSGELYIAGVGLARGYLNMPDITAARFIPDPIAGEPGKRMYRTGDLGRYQTNGRIQFLGRSDYQTKIRGYRIELGEIESALRRHPGVQDSVVVALDEQRDNKRLVAYVVLQDGQTVDANGLAAFLRESLPHYMIPSSFVHLSALPLTPHGKVDRLALPGPSETQEEPATCPRTQVEELLAGIWTRVLGVASIGRNDNFFELGGHSLLATQVVSHLREVCQVEMPLSWVFETPNLYELALRIETARRNELQLQAPPIVRGSGLEAVPLSFAQQRLWFNEQLVPGTDLYNSSVAVSLTGTVNLIALQQSFNEILRRHEVLRTSIAINSGEAYQKLQPLLQLDFPLVDLQGLQEGDQNATTVSLAREQGEQRFDLSKAPLLRAAALLVSPGERVLLLTMHHVITDNWSMNIFVGELGSLYRDFSSSQPSRLAELAIQYADYARWQRELLQGDVLDTHLEYWRSRLESAPKLLRLPTDRPRPVKRSYNCSSEYFSVPPSLLSGLKQLSRRQGVTLFMTLLAGYATLLYRYSGQPDICVGAPIANRNRAEVEDLIGYFVNILVLRTDLSGNPTCQELLRRVREITLEAYARQDFPFELLVDALRSQRSLSSVPLVQATFTFQNSPAQGFELPGVALRRIETGPSAAVEYDFSLIMGEEREALNGVVVYNTDLFDRETIHSLLNHFISILEQAVEDPLCRLLDIELTGNSVIEVGNTSSLLQNYGAQQFAL
jgi:amino acid adenylation domain-containing protein